MSKILENLQRIKSEIDTSTVKIIAVTKYVDVKEIIELYNSGIRNIGENKVQDAEEKRKNLPANIEKDIVWHFIGHLQTNKVKKVVGNYEYIHSIDSLKLAKAISEEAKLRQITQKILIQINIAEEESKFGFGLKEVKEVFQELLNLNSIDIKGLMTMAPHISEEQILHSVFKELREIRDYLQEKYKHHLPELSMGMSNDYKIAVQEGTTMIRLGRVLFQ